MLILNQHITRSILVTRIQSQSRAICTTTRLPSRSLYTHNRGLRNAKMITTATRKPQTDLPLEASRARMRSTFSPAEAASSPSPSASVDTQTYHSGWSRLWDAGDFLPWDRMVPSPALSDTLVNHAHLVGTNSLVLPDGTTRRKRALVPGCGRGVDVVLLASFGYDVVGLEYSATAVQEAERYARETEGEELYRAKDGVKDGKGSIKFVQGDFFEEDWLLRAGFDQQSKTGVFDLIYDYTVSRSFLVCPFSPSPSLMHTLNNLLASTFSKSLTLHALFLHTLLRISLGINRLAFHLTLYVHTLLLSRYMHHLAITRIKRQGSIYSLPSSITAFSISTPQSSNSAQLTDFSSSAPSTPQCVPAGPPACPPSSTPTRRPTSSAWNSPPPNPHLRAARLSPPRQKPIWNTCRIPASKSRTRLRGRSRCVRSQTRAPGRWRESGIGIRAIRMRSARVTRAKSGIILVFGDTDRCRNRGWSVQNRNRVRCVAATRTN